jgi:transcriptional regulator with XRE-family HTH domain
LDFPISGREQLQVWIEASHYGLVGACLVAARRQANVTQQALAAQLGKPQSFISEFERGRRRIDVVEFLMISRALKADPLQLLAEIDLAVSNDRLKT